MVIPKDGKELAAHRKNFIAQGWCAVCGGLATDCHEILAGSNRQAALRERACWLRLCRRCHDEVQGTDVHYQLALKLLSDPEGWNLEAFCAAWKRPESAIDLARMVEHVRYILMNR